jgi:hypothetical protein
MILMGLYSDSAERRSCGGSWTIRILPFIGVVTWPTAHAHALHHCLVSPWMANGSLREFMRSEKFDPYLDGPRFVRHLPIFS